MHRRTEILLGGLMLLTTLLGVPAQAQNRVAVEAPRYVFVVNTQDASVSLVDIATMKEIRRIPVGPRPYGIVVSRDGRRLAVGVEDEEKVKFFDTTDFKLLGETRIGKMFNDHIVLTPDGRHILVANFYSDDVVAIDAETMKEAYRIKGASAPHVIKYGPLRKYAYVTCKKITGTAIVDPQNRQLVKFHQTNVNPRSLTFAPDESKIYFGSFWVDGFFEMDTESGKVTRLFALSPPAGNGAPQELTYHGVVRVVGKDHPARATTESVRGFLKLVLPLLVLPNHCLITSSTLPAGFGSPPRLAKYNSWSTTEPLRTSSSLLRSP